MNNTEIDEQLLRYLFQDQYFSLNQEGLWNGALTEQFNDLKSLWVNFRGHVLGEFSWTFLVNFHGYFFNSNEKSYTIIKQLPNLS